jgi:type I restriction enzyme S subunit
MEKHRNIPALRFPEFDGEWERKSLGEVVNYTKGYAFKSEDYVNRGERIVRVSDLAVDSIKYKNEKIFIEKQKVAVLNNYKIDKGDIIITTVGSKPELLESAVGRGIFISKSNEGYLNQNLLKLNQSKDADNRFIFGYINSEKYIAHIKQIQRGNANQSNITVADLFKFKITIPTLLEQKKIADFLTAIDKKLQTLKKKKTLLEQYKKGVMQKIFSQELRFKDENGNDFADWETKKLGNISIKKSSNISANKIENNFGEYLIYGASGVLKKVDFYEEENDYISIVKDGAGVGRLLYCKGKSSVLGTMEIIKPKSEVIPYYLYCLLNNIDFTKYITGSTIPHIYFKDYLHEICGIPTLDEQQKIASFLIAIDQKTTQLQTQIEKTDHYKNGLLQKMFC